MQARNKQNAKGIDVSHHNGSIDWNKVAADGYSFVFIKASEGRGFRDPMFSKNVQGARKAGLLVGAYHFFKAANEREAKEEAEHFAEVLQSIEAVSGRGTVPSYRYPLDLPPVLDYEVNPAGLTAAQISSLAGIFLTEIEQQLQIKPLIYSGNAFASHFASLLGSYDLWVARYSEAAPKDVPAWKRWRFWQYSESGQVAGITGRTDLNEFDGSAADLLGWIAAYPKQNQTSTQEDEADMNNIQNLQLLLENLEKMQATVTDQAKRISELEKIVNVTGNQTPPVWASEAITAAKAAGAITSSADKGRAELVGLQVLYNLGLLSKERA